MFESVECLTEWKVNVKNLKKKPFPKCYGQSELWKRFKLKVKSSEYTVAFDVK